MTHLMQKRLSRRELLRRTEQGREAMRVLAAAVVEAGGFLRIKRDTYDGLPRGHRMAVTRDDMTGDLLLYASKPVSEAPGATELTFEEIRAKYGATRTAAPVPEETAEGDRSPDAGVLPHAEGPGTPDQES